MTFIYVMPLHEEENGYGVIQNGGYDFLNFFRNYNIFLHFVKIICDSRQFKNYITLKIIDFNNFCLFSVCRQIFLQTTTKLVQNTKNQQKKSNLTAEQPSFSLLPRTKYSANPAPSPRTKMQRTCAQPEC